MEFSKIIYRAVVAGEGETAVTLFLCREMNAYILWRSAHDAELQYVASWFLFQRDTAIEKSVSIAAAELAKKVPTPPKAAQPKPEEKPPSPQSTEKAGEERPLVLKVVIVKSIERTSSKGDKWLLLTCSPVGHRGGQVRIRVQCWIEKFIPLLRSARVAEFRVTHEKGSTRTFIKVADLYEVDGTKIGFQNSKGEKVNGTS